jgi:hypothetical protein
MPTTMTPEWNSADPRASLLAQWQFFHDHARQVFLKDGTHVEILFLLADDGTIQPVPIAKPMTRADVSSQLREQLPGSQVYGLIHIAEAWAYLPKRPDDHTRKQLEWGEMRVSSLRDEDKAELLIVSLLSRDGDSMALIDQVEREEGGQVRLGRSTKISNIEFPLGNVF